jgi:hypothetical protein
MYVAGGKKPEQLTVRRGLRGAHGKPRRIAPAAPLGSMTIAAVLSVKSRAPGNRRFIAGIGIS